MSIIYSLRMYKEEIKECIKRMIKEEFENAGKG